MMTIKWERSAYCIYDGDELVSNCDSRSEAESEMKIYQLEKEIAEEAERLTLDDLPF